MQVPFRLALALLIQSPQEWDAARRTALFNTLHAHLQPAATSAAATALAPPASNTVSGAGSTPVELWHEAAPAVRLFGLVDQLQRLLKATPGRGGDWRAAMNQRCATDLVLTPTQRGHARADPVHLCTCVPEWRMVGQDVRRSHL